MSCLCKVVRRSHQDNSYHNIYIREIVYMCLFGHMFAVLLGHKFGLLILNISALSHLLGTAIGKKKFMQRKHL